MRKTDLSNPHMLLAIALLSALFLSWQDAVRIPIRVNMVMAKNGLNMRAEPKLGAPVVIKIPYGKKIKVLAQKAFGVDTIMTYQTDEVAEIITGAWVKASFRGQTGYVSSSYLHDDSPPYDFGDNHLYNNNYRLLFPGFTCINNYCEIDDYDWLGIYEEWTEEGKKVYIKPIKKLEFVRSENKLYSQEGVLTPNRKNLNYIIGSAVPLSGYPGMQDALSELPPSGHSKAMPFDTIVLDNNDFCLEWEFNDTRRPYRNIYVKQGDDRQWLNPDYKQNSGIVQALFAGDIDGDNRKDFIIGYGEKTMRVILYLSTQRNEKYPLVKPVACYYTGYCC